jgi:uncharacterized Zn finger protein
MDSLPQLTEAVIRQHSGSQSYQRGRDYYEQGSVLSVVRRGQQLQAEVEGSDFEPYHVRISLDASGDLEATCTCPYDWGGWCKHIVATMLACIRKPEEIEERPSTESLLAGLDRQQLQALVLKLAKYQPDLADAIEAQVQMWQIQPTRAQTVPSGDLGPSTQAGAVAEGSEPPPQQRRALVDAAPYRRQVCAILHSLDRMRRSEAYWQVSSVVNEVGQVVEQAQEFIAAGDGRNALAVLEAITEEYVVGWLNLDDSDGYAGAFFGDLGSVWTEAFLTADLSPDERRAWADKLAKWQREVDDYGIDEVFGAAMAAAEHGWDHPPLLRVLQGEITETGAWEGEAPWYADDLAIARLNVLERQGRYQEYLRLAEAEGQTERYTTMLLRLGRLQEAVVYGLQYFGTTAEALALAKTLREQEDFQAALRMAEHGLTLQGPKASLAAWLSELAVGMGETGRALEAATIAFRDSPALAAYLRVKELAKERWPEIRADLLTHLATVGNVSHKIDIYLQEGMVNDAVQAVDAGPYVGYDELERVADKAFQSHPDWVIGRCRAQAEPIMNEGKSRHYHHAARWLERARSAYRAAGREAEWHAYLRELIAQHQRKYKLVPMLRALLG